MKVLVVDDFENIVEAVTLCINLRWPSAEVIVAYDGKAGLEKARTENPDMVILDINLPEMDGMAVLKELCHFSQVPVIMLTVRDSDIDIAKALEIGADDYVSKPFSPVEFLARIEAVLRRSSGHSANVERPFISGDLWINFEAGEVLANGKQVALTSTELRLLKYLMQNAGRVVSHDALLSSIWDTDRGREIDTHTIAVHMRHLRAKLGDNATNPRYITNVHGVGYKFMEKVNLASAVDSAPKEKIE